MTCSKFGYDGQGYGQIRLERWSGTSPSLREEELEGQQARIAGFRQRIETDHVRAEQLLSLFISLVYSIESSC